MAQLGALLRLELGEMNFHDAHQRSSVLYANFLACLTMGILDTTREFFEQRGLVPVFLAGSAGFCGALSTFSTWQFEVARWVIWWPTAGVLEWAGRDTWFHRRVTSAMSALLTELGAACIGYQLGRQIAKTVLSVCSACPSDACPSNACASTVPPEEGLLRGDLERPGASALALERCSSTPAVVLRQPKLARANTCLYRDGLIKARGPAEGTVVHVVKGKQRALLWGLLLLVTGAVACAAGRRDDGATLLFIILFAPCGAIARYYAGLRLNMCIAQFRLGTFLCNVGACCILASLAVIGAESDCYQGQPWIGALTKGLAVGLCGSLSTTSTLISQLHSLEEDEAVRYGIATISAAQVVYGGILGAFLGTTGVHQVC